MILCCDIGGTAIKLAYADGPGDLRLAGSVPTPAHDFVAFVAALKAAVEGAPVPPRRVSLSIAGIIDPITGRASVANIPCLTGRVLRDELTAALGRPVHIANDADCFALAEAMQGAGRGHQVVLGLILGTGIGGGLVVRGQVIEGAGEWGHGPVAQRVVGEPPVVLPAFPCGCGQSGCLDSICGARGMEMLHRHLSPGAALDSRAVVAGWQAGRAAEARTISVWLEILSGPLAMIQNLTGAGIMVVGGGLSKAAALIDALDRQTRARTLRRIDRPLIVPAQGAVEPGLIGAAILGLRHDVEDGIAAPNSATHENFLHNNPEKTKIT